MRKSALLVSAGLIAGLLPFATAATATGADESATDVTTDAAVYPVEGGDTAQVKVTLTTSGADRTKGPVTVAYRTDGGSAAAGQDYTPVSGTLTFPAGSASGASRTVTVPTHAAQGPQNARTIPVQLDVTGARAPQQTPRVVVDAANMPYLDAALPIKDRVADLLGRMSLDEKVGQMTQAERAAISPARLTTYRLGSLLSGGGSAPASNTPRRGPTCTTASRSAALATPLQIPMIYGVDAVHGHNNVVSSTIYPHNIGLGATRDPALVEKTGETTAEEIRATGPTGTSRPACASAATNAGAAPTSRSARTRRSWCRWRPSSRVCRARPTVPSSPTTTRCWHGQALRRRRWHGVRHRQR